MGWQSLPPHGLAFKYHVRTPNHCLSLHSTTAFTKHLHTPSRGPQDCPEAKGRAPQSPAPGPRAGLTATLLPPGEGLPTPLASHYRWQKLLLERGRSPAPEEGAPGSRAYTYIPDADSTWAPFTFRGVSTTRGSMTPVFFFGLFAYIPSGDTERA